MNIREIQEKLKSFIEFSAKISDSTNFKGERVYITPSGNRYPSVTTVLSKMSDMTWLEQWRDAVGHEVADKITKESTARGTSMHKLIEHHLNGEMELISRDALGYELYRSLTIFIKKVEPLSLELALYSDRLKIAGRTDCIGVFDGVLSVIDFKSSRKPKTPEDIINYFLQCTLYSLMLYELTGIKCKQIVILIAVSGGVPQVFKRNLIYVQESIKLVRQYHSLYNDEFQPSPCG